METWEKSSSYSDLETGLQPVFLNSKLDQIMNIRGKSSCHIAYKLLLCVTMASMPLRLCI